MTAVDEHPDGEVPSSEKKDNADNSKAKGDSNQVTKLSINQYIVLMRKDVNRARVRLIRKMTKNIPKFREKKGADSAKYQRRAELLVEEIQVMKKLQPDQVSKYALCSKLSSTELEKQMDKLSTEQRALARLAAHKLVQDKIAAFYEKYNVKKERVTMLVKALGVRSAKRNKTKGKISKDDVTVKLEQKKPKEQKEVGSAKSKENRVNRVNDDDDLVAEGDVEKGSSEAGKEDNESDIETSGNQSGLYVRAPAISDSDSDHELDDQIASDSDEDVESSAGFESRVNLLKSAIDSDERHSGERKKSKVDWKALPLRNAAVDRTEGSLTVKRLNLNKISGDTIEEVVKKSKTDSVKEEKHHIPADAFFLGAEVTETEAETDHQHEKFGKKRDFAPKGNREGHGRINKAESSFVKLGGKGRNFGPGKSSNEPRNKNFDTKRKMPSQNLPTQPVDEKLHPSWAAKKKQKEITIDSFHGKKIKFDDDD